MLPPPSHIRRAVTTELCILVDEAVPQRGILGWSRALDFLAEGEVGTEDTMRLPHQMLKLLGQTALDELVFFHVGRSFGPQVYGLMEKRLRQECRKQQISEEIRQKIWTCFDHSLVHFAELMLDRHLDQLMLCAIKIMTKVSRTLLSNYISLLIFSHSLIELVLLSLKSSIELFPVIKNTVIFLLQCPFSYIMSNQR